MVKLLKKNRITSLLQVFFVVLLMVTVSGCGSYSGTDAYEEYKELTAVDESNINNAINKCFYCKIFLLIFDAINVITTQAVKDTRESAATILAICFGLWLLVKMFIIFASMKQVNLGEQWADIVTRLFWLLVISTFLSSDAFMTEFFDYTVVALFEGASGIAMELTDMSGTGMTTDTTACASITSTSASGILPKDVGAQFACLLLKINQTIYEMQLIATVIKAEVKICEANLSSPHLTCKGFLPFLASIFMLLMSFIITLFYPIYFIDAIVRAGIISVLMPFIMVAFVFPASRSFASDAFRMLMNMVFGVIVLTLILVSIMYVMDLVLLTTYLDGVTLSDVHKKGDEFIEKIAGKSPEVRVIGLLQVIFMGVTSIYMIITHGSITNIFANTAELNAVLGAVVKTMARAGKIAWEVARVVWDVGSIAAAILSGGAAGVASTAVRAGVSGGIKVGGVALKEGMRQGFKKGAGVAKQAVSKRIYSKSYNKSKAKGALNKFTGSKYNSKSVVGRALNYRDYVKKQFKNDHYDNNK